MFISPISGEKLRPARVKGGQLWYCPDSHARLLTLVMAKHYFGVDGAREIWVRAQLSKIRSDIKCPSCTQYMSLVSEPSWLGGGEIDVCLRCHLIWISPDRHTDKVPTPSDMITPRGDSTVIARQGEGLAEAILTKDKLDREKDSLVARPPESLLLQLVGFIGLPVEESYAKPKWVWATGAIAILSILALYFSKIELSLIENWGFYPGEFWKNGGLNIFSSVLLHGGIIHLITNLYFFCIFADDIEEAFGTMGFLGFVAFVCIGDAVLLSLLSGSPETPHVGLSGLIMGVLVAYSLEFRTRKVLIALPAFHLIYRRYVFSHIDWLRLPVWLLAGFYLVKDLVLFFVLERGKMTNVSHSSHVAGAIMGILFWFIFRTKESAKDKLLMKEIGRRPTS